MAGLFGLLGGGGSDPLDIYGDLFSKEQKAALQQRQAGEGLLRMAGAFGAAAQPSRMPTSFMGALGQAAGAMAGHGDEAANTALKGMEVAEKVRQSRAERAILAKAAPFVEAITKQLIGAGVPAAEAAQLAPQIATQVAGGAGAPQAPGAPAAPPDAPVPPGAPQPPGAPSLNAIGMPPPRNNTAFGMPPRPGQPPGMAPGAERFWPAPTTPDQIQPLSGQQNAGLLDQVVGPDGQPLTGPGVLPRLAAGGGAPPPFQLASSTPTGGATRGAAGGDVVIPSGPRLQRSDLTNVAAPAGAFDQAVNYLQQELGLAPHQARGAVKWMNNVESKLDPNAVNPTSGALGVAQHLGPRKRALTAQYGANPSFEQQLAFIKDELQGPEKAALNSLRNAGTENEAFRAWGKDFERPSAAEYAKATGQDYVIPSGLGVPRSALTNVADTGAAPGGGGFLPGTTVTPEALAALNAMLKMGGMKSDPFGSLLESYYKSPGYIAEAERTRAQAGKDVSLKMDPLIEEQKKRAEYKVDMQLKPELEAAVARLQSPILKEREQAKADIDRVTKQLEQAGAAALKPTDATVIGDDGKPVATRITELELAKRQQARAERVARGDTRMEPGDIVGTPVLSPEETAAQTQRGKTGQEMTTVQVWTPNGLVSQQMTNLEAAARRKMIGERGPAGPPQVGDIVDAPALTEPEKKIAGALGEDFVALRRQAQAASSTISSTHDLRAKLDSGIFTGLDANWSLFAAKLGETLGWTGLSNPEKVKNTEVYISGIGKEVLAMVKELRPASNVDLQFAERMAGGQNMSAGAIRELLDMRERYARLAVERHNEEARGMNPGAFTGFRREIPMPPPYQQKSGTTPGGLRWKE